MTHDATPGIVFPKGACGTAKLMVEITLEKIAELLQDLPPDDLKKVLTNVVGRLEAQGWMGLGELGFREWLMEPDLYGDDGPTDGRHISSGGGVFPAGCATISP